MPKKHTSKQGNSKKQASSLSGVSFPSNNPGAISSMPDKSTILKTLSSSTQNSNTVSTEDKGYFAYIINGKTIYLASETKSEELANEFESNDTQFNRVQIVKSGKGSLEDKLVLTDSLSQKTNSWIDLVLAHAAIIGTTDAPTIVNCRQGQTRTAVVVMAYLMLTGRKPEDVYKEIREKYAQERSGMIADPNNNLVGHELNNLKLISDRIQYYKNEINGENNFSDQDQFKTLYKKLVSDYKDENHVSLGIDKTKAGKVGDWELFRQRNVTDLNVQQSTSEQKMVEDNVPHTTQQEDMVEDNMAPAIQQEEMIVDNAALAVQTEQNNNVPIASIRRQNQVVSEYSLRITDGRVGKLSSLIKNGRTLRNLRSRRNRIKELKVTLGTTKGFL